MAECKYSQNIEIENSKDAILSMMMNASKNKTLKSDNGDFSNLLHNISAKLEKTQTNFVDKAVKSNTSSINKFALNSSNSSNSSNKSDNKTTQDVSDKTQVQDDKKNILKNTPKKASKIKKQTKTDNSYTQAKNKASKKTNTQEKDSSPIITSINADKTSEKPVLKTGIEDETTQTTVGLSDINNSSDVLPSPFYCGENIEDTTTVSDDNKTNVQKLLQNFVVSLDIDLNQNADLKLKLDDIIQNTQTFQDALSAIDEINKTLENFDLFKDGQEDLNAKFAQFLDDIKNIVKKSDELSSGENIKYEESDLNTNSKDEVFEVKEDKNLSDFIQEDETKDVFKDEIKENRVFASSDKKAETSETQLLKTKEDTTKVENFNNENQNISTKADENISLNSNLSEKKPPEHLSQIKDVYSDIVKLTSSEEDFSRDAVSKFYDKFDYENNLFNSDIFKKTLDFAKENGIDIKFDINENAFSQNTLKDDISKLMSVFEEIQKSDSYNLFSQDEKELVEDITDKLAQILNSNNLNEEISTLADKSTPVDTSDFTKELIHAKDTEKPVFYGNDKKDTAIDNKDNQQTLDYIKDDAKTLDLSYDDLNSGDTYENQNQDKTPKVEISQNDEIEVKDNTKKDAFISSIKDEMLENIEYSSYGNSALTVSDEIAKMALEESNSINQISAQGSITYDPASGNNVIKNALSQIRNAQIQTNSHENFDNVLEQIGSRLSQLKDNQGHRMTIVLRPNDLGRLSIELTSDNSGLSANIMAQNNDVRNFIEKNINNLRQKLDDAGINVNGISIKTSGQEGSTRYDGNHNFSQEQFNQNENQHNFNQNRENSNSQNEKEQREILASLSNYDLNFTKDFSAILNKTLDYTLT